MVQNVPLRVSLTPSRSSIWTRGAGQGITSPTWHMRNRSTAALRQQQRAMSHVLGSGLMYYYVVSSSSGTNRWRE
jgi:hypothetical protein